MVVALVDIIFLYLQNKQSMAIISFFDILRLSSFVYIVVAKSEANKSSKIHAENRL